MTLKAARKTDQEISEINIAKTVSDLKSLPSTLNQYLGSTNSIQDIAYKLSTASDVLFLGRGLMYPVALREL